MNSLRRFAFGFLLILGPTLYAAPDVLIADFEGTNYGGWKATGEAFGTGPARGTLPNQMNVDGYWGSGLVSSFNKGDNSTGTLTSPSFKIQRMHLRFLIGGGGYAGETCLNLLVEGKVVRTATGPNTVSGGSERLDWQQWEVGEFADRTATLQIVDQRTGGWGHINVDHILQTDQRLPGWLTNVTRELKVTKKYLNLPVKNGAPKRLVSLLISGQLQRQFEIELADNPAPDWWAFLDLTPFTGKAIVLQIDQVRENSKTLQMIEQADAIQGGEEMYRERLRPQFHFTSQRGWLNDPNGLVFYKGEYHLFYQHNPYGWNWGNMHWGHAVSSDLLHWQERGEALYPDPTGTMFSGGAVVDHRNTAGLAKDGAETPLVCFYTAAGGTSLASKGQPFTQAMAYSLDGGRTWQKHGLILPHVRAENRDPKVVWYEPTKKWVMALYLDKSDFALFESTDLKSWKKLCDVTIPGSSECPEFFEIPVENQTGDKRWIFYGANGRYLVGRFDGTNFTSDSGPHELNSGNCFYASQTYSDLPESDGRRVMIGWGRMNLPGMPFNQMMDFPVELTLHQTSEGLRLSTWPVQESISLRTTTNEVNDVSVTSGEKFVSAAQGELLDIEAKVSTADIAEFNVRGIPITYDAKKGELRCLNNKATLKSGEQHLRILVDRASIEIFANGQVYMPMGVLLNPEHKAVVIRAKEGDVKMSSLRVHQLKSIWPM